MAIIKASQDDDSGAGSTGSWPICPNAGNAVIMMKDAATRRTVTRDKHFFIGIDHTPTRPPTAIV